MLIKSADHPWFENDTVNTTTTIFGHEIKSPGNTTISCLLINHEEVLCNGVRYFLPEPIIDSSDGVFWMYLAIYIFLVLFAGLMSGLTLAILSLDLTSLKVTLAAGSGKSARYAKRLIPLVKRRHTVLVTLVLANAFSVEAMPLFMDRISNPITAVLVSCTAVLIFGEVLPQAISSRFGLQIGYALAWLVWLLTGLLFFIVLPFAYLLDALLGKDSGTFYGRKELQALVDIHGPKDSLSRQSSVVQPKRNPFSCAACKVSTSFCTERLTEDEVMIIKGALKMSSKTASTAMVKLEDVFMLSSDTVFDQACVKAIFEIGHSRIPIYENDRQNVIGVFLTKRLITIDPNQGIKLSQLITDTSISRAFYTGLKIDQHMPLFELLNRFQTGTMSHIAFVTCKNDVSKEEMIIGIVTLEDVIEELLQEEIFDESDVKRNLRVISTALPKIYRQLNASNQKLARINSVSPEHTLHKRSCSYPENMDKNDALESSQSHNGDDKILTNQNGNLLSVPRVVINGSTNHNKYMFKHHHSEDLSRRRSCECDLNNISHLNNHFDKRIFFLDTISTKTDDSSSADNTVIDKDRTLQNDGQVNANFVNDRAA